MPREGGRTGRSIREEYSEPLAAWIFPRQGTHGSYAVDECARTRFVCFPKKYRGRWKNQVTTTKEQRTTQAGCTKTSTEGRAPYRTAHLTAAEKPSACVYFSAFRRMRFTYSAVVSNAYVNKT